MVYDSFIEIENKNGVYEHYYFNKEKGKSGRKLNEYEVCFLKMVYDNGFYSFSFVDRIFNLMENASEEKWLRVLSGGAMYIRDVAKL